LGEENQLQEAQRFLRYVVPGLIWIIEFLAYLLISGDICFRQLIDYASSKGVGVAVSAFLVSGSLGFLFGVFYYTVVWWEKISGKRLCILKIGADHRRVLKAVYENNGNSKWLKFYWPDGTDVPVTKLNKLKNRGAWRVVASYLNARAKASKRIKGAIRGMDRLSDLMNGLGTACLGSSIALLFFVIYNVVHAFPGEFSCRGLGSFIFGSGILILHCLNYKGVVEDYENVCGSLLLNEFELEYDENKHIIKLYVWQNDLNEDC
jgi:hypothetical protein